MNYDRCPFARTICAKLELWRALTLQRGVSDEALQEEAERKLDEIVLPHLASAYSQGTSTLDILRFISTLAKMHVLDEEEGGNETVHLVPRSALLHLGDIGTNETYRDSQPSNPVRISLLPA
jgi:hypothetical protein